MLFQDGSISKKPFSIAKELDKIHMFRSPLAVKFSKEPTKSCLVGYKYK